MVAALSTTFSPPSSCFDITYTPAPLGSDTIINILSGSPTYTTYTSAVRGVYEECFPPDYLRSADPEGGWFYSPGICPSSYVSGKLAITSSTTTATCCPYGMAAWASLLTLYTTETVSGTPLYTRPQSETTVARCTGKPKNSGVYRGVILSKATETSKLLVDAEVAPAIVIQWQSSDFALTSGPSPTTHLTSLTALVTSVTLFSSSASGSAKDDDSETSTSTANRSHPRLSHGETAGIAIGCTFAGLLLIGVAFLFWRRRSSRQSKIDHPEPLEGSSAPKPSLEEVATVSVSFQDVNEMTELPEQCRQQELEAWGSTAELDGGGQRTEVVTRPEDGDAKRGRPDGPSSS